MKKKARTDLIESQLSRIREELKKRDLSDVSTERRLAVLVRVSRMRAAMRKSLLSGRR